MTLKTNLHKHSNANFLDNPVLCTLIELGDKLNNTYFLTRTTSGLHFLEFDEILLCDEVDCQTKLLKIS